MLPKINRLPLRTDLVRIRQKGKLFSGRLFSLLVARKEASTPSQFGFIISTKVHKRAVKRNRARRLLIEAIRDLLSQLKPGFEGVFLAKKNLIDQDRSKVAQEVENIFRQAGLLKK